MKWINIDFRKAHYNGDWNGWSTGWKVNVIIVLVCAATHDYFNFFNGLLKIGGETFKLGQENRKIIQKALSEKTVKELEDPKVLEDYFMNHILIITSSPDLETLKTINNDLIKELHYDDNCDRLLSILRKNFLMAIGATCLGKTTTRNILTENNLLLQNSILEAFLEKTTQEFLETISSRMEFKEDFLRHFENQRIFGFRDKKNLATFLTYQTVRRDKQEVYIVSLASLSDQQIHSLRKFNKNVVVVVESSHFPKELFKNDNVTFVVKEDSELDSDGKTVCNVEQLYIFQLTKESRMKCLSEKLKIQNMSLSFSDLQEHLQKFVSNSEMFEILDTILDRLVEKCGKVELGKPLPSDDVAEIYFSRKAPFVRINPGNVNDLLDEEDLVSGSKNYIIMGDPGTGKTFAMKYIAMRSKETNPAMWVEYIDLKLHSKLFEKNPVEQFSTGESKNFLLNNLISSGGDKSLDHKTLKSYLNSGHNVPVLLIFDGFDEVVPSYEIKILNLISKFVEGGIRVFTAFKTYHFMSSFDSFDIVKILPFDLSSLKMLFSQYLIEELTVLNVPVKDSNIVNQFCSSLVEWFLNSTDLTTPMFLKMLANHYRNDLINYLNGSSDISEILLNANIVKIYNKIYEICFENFSEKAGGDADNNLKKLIIADEMNQYRRIYGDLAYRDLRRSLVELPGVTEVHLPPVEVTLTDGQRALLLAQGFVVLINGDFRFVHRTFAEFFHSDLLVERLKEGDDNVINYLSTLPFDRVSEFLYLQTMEKIINENFPIVSMIQDHATKFKNFAKFLETNIVVSLSRKDDNIFKILDFIVTFFPDDRCENLVFDEALPNELIGNLRTVLENYCLTDYIPSNEPIIPPLEFQIL
ncbi:hypothetical protein DMENIID0001_164330 [Sergentomyia squamirostris]